MKFSCNAILFRSVAIFSTCTMLSRNTALFLLGDSSSLLVNAFIPSPVAICKKSVSPYSECGLPAETLHRLWSTSFPDSGRQEVWRGGGKNEQRSATLDTSWHHSKSFYCAS
jgi:hypothetical protein